MTLPPIPRMARAIDNGDIVEIRKVLAEFPDQKTYPNGGGGSWLHIAVRQGNIDVLDALIDAGIDINIDVEDPPLAEAASCGQIEAARHLISRGADVNLGRAFIGAINVSNDLNQDSPEREIKAFELVKLLVESGADVNRWWYFGDSKKGVIQNALSWAIVNGREDIADYLRAHGAVMPPKEERHRGSFWTWAWRLVFGAKQSRTSEEGIEQEVIAQFEKLFGPCHPLSLGEIVPSESSIRVHVIPASGGRNHITLFTTGMARNRMKAPSKEYKNYEHVELFIQLPASWPYKDILNPDHAWPMHWLRMMAVHPLEKGIWLPPITVIANDRDEPIASNARFTAMLLLAELSMTSKAGCPVQFYRLTPLYPEERQMELDQGIDAVMRAFDKYDVPFVVDLHRRNVAKP